MGVAAQNAIRRNNSYRYNSRTNRNMFTDEKQIKTKKIQSRAIGSPPKLHLLQTSIPIDHIHSYLYIYIQTNQWCLSVCMYVIRSMHHLSSSIEAYDKHYFLHIVHCSMMEMFNCQEERY